MFAYRQSKLACVDQMFGALGIDVFTVVDHHTSDGVGKVFESKWRELFECLGSLGAAADSNACRLGHTGVIIRDSLQESAHNGLWAAGWKG